MREEQENWIRKNILWDLNGRGDSILSEVEFPISNEKPKDCRLRVFPIFPQG